MPFGLLEIGLQIALAVHAARTGRMQPWLWIILFLPGIGSLLYVVIELVPEFMGGRTGRRIGAGVVTAVAPPAPTAPWPGRPRSRPPSTTGCVWRRRRWR